MDSYKKNSLAEMMKNNPYAGRGIALGQSADGNKAVAVYFIMGRSENSRNRIFIEQGEDLSIHPYDISKVEDPSLIIYSPLRVFSKDNKKWMIVTNGDQTDTIFSAISAGKTFEEALDTRCFEPDAPNYTPRISGLMCLEKEKQYTYKLNILKSADAQGTACIRETFAYPALSGVGHFISTYVTDGSPLPTFTGEPIRIEIPCDIKKFAEDLWSNLNNDNKISLYVRSVDLSDGTIQNVMFNKHEPK